MTNRDVVNMIIKIYLSNPSDQYQATLNNELINRLNDIVDKADKYDNGLSNNKENETNSDTKLPDKYVNKQMWEMNYTNACLYFYVCKNTQTNKYSIQWRTTVHYDFSNSKYILIKELPGIRFSKYESYQKKVYELYNKYCAKYNNKPLSNN